MQQCSNSGSCNCVHEAGNKTTHLRDQHLLIRHLEKAHPWSEMCTETEAAAIVRHTAPLHSPSVASYILPGTPPGCQQARLRRCHELYNSLMTIDEIHASVDVSEHPQSQWSYHVSPQPLKRNTWQQHLCCDPSPKPPPAPPPMTWDTAIIMNIKRAALATLPKRKMRSGHTQKEEASHAISAEPSLPERPTTNAAAAACLPHQWHDYRLSPAASSSTPSMHAAAMLMCTGSLPIQEKVHQ